MSNTVAAQPGDRVLILTSELQEDPNVYLLEEIKRSVAFLKSEDTGCQVKAHKSRIRQVLQEDDMNDNNVNEVENESTAVVNETEGDTPEEPKTVLVDEEQPKKAKRTRAPKPDPVKVDFEQAPFAGHEIWTKGGCKFDFDKISVAAHCIILDDGYQTFNTYNGTLGKKGQLPEDGSLPGVFYNFTEKMTAEKKREQLGKKGYARLNEAEPDEPDESDKPEE